ncbi:MAG: hypothetical protein QOK01_856, partial [Alphaproteobacteria bacterium]|nr:hypothetical protein [Alphaproteobacteria bacterium]
AWPARAEPETRQSNSFAPTKISGHQKGQGSRRQDRKSDDLRRSRATIPQSTERLTPIVGRRSLKIRPIYWGSIKGALTNPGYAALLVDCAALDEPIQNPNQIYDPNAPNYDDHDHQASRAWRSVPCFFVQVDSLPDPTPALPSGDSRAKEQLVIAGLRLAHVYPWGTYAVDQERLCLARLRAPIGNVFFSDRQHCRSNAHHRSERKIRRVGHQSKRQAVRLHQPHHGRQGHHRRQSAEQHRARGLRHPAVVLPRHHEHIERGR